MRCTVGRFENCGPPQASSARPETNKEPSCSEIEVSIRDFESGPGVFADDGAFAFGSRRDIDSDIIELGARILYIAKVPGVGRLGRIYVTLKQVSEVLSMGSAWKTL